MTSGREAELFTAAIELLRDWPYSELSLGAVALHAEIPMNTVRTRFPSKAVLVAEVFLGRVRGTPVVVEDHDSTQQRVAKQLKSLMLLIADNSYLAEACLISLMSDDPAVAPIRDQLSMEVRQRIVASLGPGYAPEVADALHMLYSGALVHARSDTDDYRHIVDQLADTAAAIVTCAVPRQQGF